MKEYQATVQLKITVDATGERDAHDIVNVIMESLMESESAFQEFSVEITDIKDLPTQTPL